HVSSMGKAMLAAMPDQMAEEMISQLDLQAYTEYTVTDPQVLEQQVAAGRHDGYVYQNQEVDLGMNALAAPVTTPAGRSLRGMEIEEHLVRANKQQVWTYRYA